MMSKLAIVEIMALLMAFGSAGAHGQTIDNLFGSWEGTWYVDEQFDQFGNPFGTPPYAPEPILFQLHDWTGSSYGEVSFSDSALTGSVISLAINLENVVTMSVFSEEADGTAEVVGILDGDSITGDYDDQVPAPPGYISWRGPFSVSLVPEPTTLSLLLLGGLVALRRRR